MDAKVAHRHRSPRLDQILGLELSTDSSVTGRKVCSG